MIHDPQAFLLVTVLTIIFFWSVPNSQHFVRCWVLILSSLLLIFFLSPTATIFVLFASSVVYFSSKLMRKFTNIPIVFIVISVFIILVIGLKKITVPIFPVALGVSFVFLKSVSAILDETDSIAEGKPPVRVSDILLLNSFFPIFSAGPVERISTFRRENLGTTFQLIDFGEGLLRFIVGVFKVSFLSLALCEPMIYNRFENIYENVNNFGVYELYIYSFLCLINLYISFSGFTDIAIGIGLMLGLRIRENFNMPFLATNLVDFWGRWHISLRDFAYDYIFFPLAKVTKGKVSLSIIITFLLVGLWHGISEMWIAWGLLHGIGLALVGKLIQISKKNHVYAKLRTSVLGVLIGWSLTMVYVSTTLALVQAPSIELAFVFFLGLFGIF